jgi:hypothetical protein
VKGVLFKPDMIKAILERRKTVTRRVIKYSTASWNYLGKDRSISNGKFYFCFETNGIPPLTEIMPRYHAGEIVYVNDNKYNDYVASFEWMSPLFLSAKYARTFLKIKDIRPERLQEMNRAEALLEGIRCHHCQGYWVWLIEFEVVPKQDSAK